MDLQRYGIALKTCRNFIVLQYGGVANRPGTGFIDTLLNPSKKGRLISFNFSDKQSYGLVFENLIMRVIKDGGLVLNTTGPNIGLPFELVTPYLEADLPFLKYTQSFDTLTITHPNHKIKQITRTAHDVWTIADFAFINGPFQDLNVAIGTTVTSSATTGTVTLTASAALFTTANIGQLFYLEIKDLGLPWEQAKVVAIGDIRRSDSKYYKSLTAATTGSAKPLHDHDTASDGAVSWEYLHDGYGIALITASSGPTNATATVKSYIPDSLVGGGSNTTYRWALGAWGGSQGYPTCTTYTQQRQVFGGTPAQPEDYWMSKTDGYIDFGKSAPGQDDDAIRRRVSGQKANFIKHFLPTDKLGILTSGGEFVESGNQNGVLTPSEPNIKQQSARGTSEVAPLIVGDTALFVQSRGSVVRDFAYSFEADKFTGSDLTVWSSHLFKNHTVLDWAFAQIPFSCAWVVREDGTLLGLTYMREQQVIGWHRHDTDGLFESVCVVSEGDEDILYVIVKRIVNNNTVRYIERMHSRQFTDQRDAKFLDCSLSYDGRNTTITTINILQTPGTATWGWRYGIFEIDASAAIFTFADVGREFHFPIDDQVIRLMVTGYTDSQRLTATANRDIPVGLQNLPTSNWGKAIFRFPGFAHLEAKKVGILADAFVVTPQTVVGGVVELPKAAVVVHIGLPIEADFETLDVIVQNADTIRAKQKNIPTLRLLVQESRGIFAGPDAAHLDEALGRDVDDNYDTPIQLKTGVVEIRITNGWDSSGTTFVRQSDPLPLTILAAIPEVVVGG